MQHQGRSVNVKIPTRMCFPILDGSSDDDIYISASLRTSRGTVPASLAQCKWIRSADG